MRAAYSKFLLVADDKILFITGEMELIEQFHCRPLTLSQFL
jgi:hypothetical protein